SRLGGLDQVLPHHDPAEGQRDLHPSGRSPGRAAERTQDTGRGDRRIPALARRQQAGEPRSGASPQKRCRTDAAGDRAYPARTGRALHGSGRSGAAARGGAGSVSRDGKGRPRADPRARVICRSRLGGYAGVMNDRSIVDWLPKSLVQRPPVVTVVRLAGVIGSLGPLRGGITLTGVAGTLERAFRAANLKAVALTINSPGGSPVQSALIAK